MVSTAIANNGFAKCCWWCLHTFIKAEEDEKRLSSALEDKKPEAPTVVTSC